MAFCVKENFPTLPDTAEFLVLIFSQVSNCNLIANLKIRFSIAVAFLLGTAVLDICSYYGYNNSLFL